MAGTTSKPYALAAVQCVVGTVNVSGYADEADVIEVEEEADLFESSTGADGESADSLVANDTAYVTIKVLETSRAYPLLGALLEAQVASVRAGLGHPVMPYSHVDPHSGESLIGAQVVFMRRPNMSKGRVAGTREFRLKIAKPVRLYGPLNLA